MIHPYSLDPETIAQLRQLVATNYAGRDDLYTAAEHLDDEDLSAICRKLADDLAGNTAFLEQIIVMHGAEPGFAEKVAFTLGEEIMQFLRSGRGDQSIVSAMQDKQGQLREKYDETIAATDNPEAQSILEQQKKDVDFAERVLRQVSPADKPQSNADNKDVDKTGDPGQTG
jgi:uncharacterized protein (TIGR02284 family)